MARKPNATREFKTSGAKLTGSAGSGKRTQTSVAYRTARMARARQKREIEQQKREKLIFALFVVVVLVMIIFAILVFKKFLGNAPEEITDDTTPIAAQSVVEDPVLIHESAVSDGLLLIVNSGSPSVSYQKVLTLIDETRTPFTNENGKTVYPYYVAKRYEDKLDKTALDAFNHLANDFYGDTKTKSNDLFVRKAYTGDSSVYSMGTSLDLEMWQGNDAYFPISDSRYESEYAWLKANAHKYGFIITSDTDKKFTIRYVGEPHAEYMYQNDMGLEEYVEYVKSSDITLDDCRVFYVKINGEYTEIPISKDSDYSVSGNNTDGVIVTVKTK